MIGDLRKIVYPIEQFLGTGCPLHVHLRPYYESKLEFDSNSSEILQLIASLSVILYPNLSGKIQT